MFFGKRKYIYGLRKLNTKTIVYVGQSFSPEKRLVSHIKDAKLKRHININLQNWILTTLRDSTIVIEILDECSEYNANKVEKKWIDIMKKSNPRLFNKADPTKAFSG